MPLTFFLSRSQRRAVLRTLALLSDDRTRALLIALGERGNNEHTGVSHER